MSNWDPGDFPEEHSRKYILLLISPDEARPDLLTEAGEAAGRLFNRHGHTVIRLNTKWYSWR